MSRLRYLTQATIAAASNVPLADAGGHFATDNAEQALQEVGSQLASIGTTLQTPIATITATGRTEVTASAVDTATDTITANGHGLQNGWYVSVTPNNGPDLIYLPNIIPGGLSAGTAYRVVNATANTFQLSLTAGGAAIDLTANANLDLTKFHFEGASTERTTLDVVNLPAKKKYRAVFRGKSLRIDGIAIAPILPTPWNLEINHWMRNGGTTWTAAYANLNADSTVILSVIADFYSRQYSAVCRFEGLTVKTNTASANTTTLIDLCAYSPYYQNLDITAIRVTCGGGLANGSVLEVYELL